MVERSRAGEAALAASSARVHVVRVSRLFPLRSTAMATANPPLPSVVARQQAVRDRLPFPDARDFEDAERGLIGRLEPCVITDADGRVIWDNDSYAFLAQP